MEGIILKEDLDFGDALMELKVGNKVARKGWNGKGQYIALYEPTVDSDMHLPYIFIKTVQNETVPWLASQADLLAEDWMVVK